jgi:hypothetical protein
MSWLEVVNKNKKEFEKSTVIEEVKEEEEEISLEYLILKNPEDEFERLYFSKIVDLKVDFTDYLKEEALPFLDRFNYKNDYSFYNFIKYYSHNYYEIVDSVEKENEEIIRNEEEQLDEDFNDNDYDFV